MERAKEHIHDSLCCASRSSDSCGETRACVYDRGAVWMQNATRYTFYSPSIYCRQNLENEVHLMVAQSRSFICKRLTTFSKALACAHPSDGWAANVHRQETLTQASKALVESCLVSGIKMYKLQYDVKQKYLLPLPLPCSYYSLHLTYRLTMLHKY